MEILKEFGIGTEMVETLNKAAIEMVDKAYAEYSQFYVGAAILTESGKIITGANVENSSYGASICAERAAVFKMVSMGERKIKAIAVHIRAKNFLLYPMPCGMCRQVLCEFGYFPIICCKSPTNYLIKTVSSMLPYIFRSITMKEHIFHPNPKDLDEVIDAAEYWLQLDPEISTRKQVETWLVHDDFASMRKYLCKRIDFGTAGLRGEMGAGYSRMNYLIVQQASQGIAKYLLESCGEAECKSRGVVIGYDGRHNSKGFAHISAAVFLHYGIKCLLFEDYCCTPLVPYSVIKYKCLAGVMVTASHNPKQDNGYKVYWTNGAQITEPTDRHIREHIKQNLVPIDLSKCYDYSEHKALMPLGKLREETMKLYLEDATKGIHRNSPELNAKCRPLVYTAMHGVGYIFTEGLLKALGFRNIIPVPSQVHPDPEFPTVVYPNPEEGEGALNEAMKVAAAKGSTVILANDPDADRLALAEQQKDGKWHIFTGDQIGTIFAAYLASQYKGDLTKCAMVASTVSSKMIKGICLKHKMRFEETLTGFKWISNKVLDLEKEGFNVLFSYEEAIGFSIGDIVRDKDGVTAAACLSELYAQLSEKGKSFMDYLEEVYKEYSYYLTKNHYFLCYEPEKMKRIFDAMRNGGKYTPHCGEFEIEHVRDITTGYDSSTEDKKARLPVTPSTEMVTYTFKNGGTCTLRGSGTEPKLKFYIEYHDADRQKTLDVLARMHKAIVDNFLKPDFFGLLPPKA